MDELLCEFVEETLDMIEAVFSDLVAWEADPSDRSGVDRIFRTIHTVKGSSSFFDLPRITAIAHAAEDVLDAMRTRSRAPDKEVVTVVLSTFEQIRSLTQSVAENGSEPLGDDSAIIAALTSKVRSRIKEQAHSPVDCGEKAGSQNLPGLDEKLVSSTTEWRSVRVPLPLMDKVMSGISDLVLARNEVAAQLRTLGFDLQEMAAFGRMSDLIGVLRGGVTQMRMVPLRHMFAPLPRMIRQLGDDLNKNVQLKTLGGEVEIDREVIEALRDPIVHVLRNAIDHGVETAAVREAGGKPPIAMVTITGRQAGNRILITIADDGAGLAEQKLAARAVDAGYCTPEQAENYNSEQLCNLIFLPGLSTASAVSGVSGRGVGMDIVKANVEKLGGSVQIDSQPGQGTAITFDVPMTLTIISALAIEVSGKDYAVPRNNVTEVLLMQNDLIQRVDAGGKQMVRVRGKMMPHITLEAVLGLPCAEHIDEDRAIILCTPARAKPFALEVPDVRDHEELVIKPLPPILGAIGIYNGFSLPDNGRPMLVLDIDGISRQVIGVAEQAAIIEPDNDVDSEQYGDAERWLSYRPWGDAGLAALPIDRIEKLIDLDCRHLLRVGDTIVANIDDRLLQVETGNFDIPLSGHVRMIMVGDGNRTLLVPIIEVVQITELTLQMPVQQENFVVLGLAILDGAMVEMLSIDKMLDRHLPPESKLRGVEIKPRSSKIKRRASGG